MIGNVAGKFITSAQGMLMPKLEYAAIDQQLMQLDSARLSIARQRQAALWRGQTPDAWPINASAALTPAQKALLPQADLAQAFYDSDLMLAQQLYGYFAAANSGSDAVPSIRANTGVGTLIAMLGHDQMIFPDKMPWLGQHFSKAEISKMTPDDFRIRGDIARALAHMCHFRAVLREPVPIFCPDTQGPFDLAHLMLGDALFLEVYDDPPFVHHLLQLCVELGTAAHLLAKTISGEPRQHMWHNGIYAENMGIRICEDTTTIVGPDIIDEFAMPYTQQLAQRFGGAWVHYCGRNDNLTDRVLALDDVRGINFGHIPGHEHDHNFEDDMQRCLAAGKVYFGDWPKRPNESGPAYLQRLHCWASQGCLLPSIGGGVADFDDIHAALDFWYSL